MKIFAKLFLLPVAGVAAWAATSPHPVTYYKDVLPVLQDHCQGCHRPGEIGSFPMMNYQSTRPWAKSIKAAVLTKKMPPWYADPKFGHFANDRTLTKAQIDTLAAWADSGASEGDKRDAPPPREFVAGWNIRKPDLVLEMPQAFTVPARGEVDYQYVVLPTGLTKDTWIQMTEVRPTGRSVVHHVVVFIRDPTSKWLRGEAQPGIPFTPPAKNPDGSFRADINGNGNNEILTIYTPGMAPDIWSPGVGKRIPAGADLVFQIHYTVDGMETGDRTKIGLVFASEQPAMRAMTLMPANVGFKIPPGDPNYKVETKAVLPNGATLLSFFPHMHLRGKAFEYRAVYPSGETETLLKVNNYDFHWQLSYKMDPPKVLPPGTRFECTAWYDNSANNPNNPDPSATVRFGEQSREEMMIGFVDVEMPSTMTMREFFSHKKAE